LGVAEEGREHYHVKQLGASEQHSIAEAPLDALDGLPHAVHPNDMGFQRMTECLTPQVARALFGQSP